MAIPKRQFKRAHEALRSVGGFTMNARTGGFPSRGWTVATRSDTDLERTPSAEMTPDSLADFHDRRRGVLQRTGHMGGWESGGEDYIEPSRRFPETSRGFMRAQQAMHAHDQEAMFKLSQGRSYWNTDQFKSMGDYLDSPARDENRASLQEWASSELRRRHPQTARRAGL